MTKWNKEKRNANAVLNLKKKNANNNEIYRARLQLNESTVVRRIFDYRDNL